MSARVGRLAALLLALVLTACTDKAQGEPPLQTMTEAQARALVQSYADAAAASVSSELANYTASKAACQGRNGETAADGRFDVAAVAQIPLAADQHVATLQRIHDDWAAKGYEITDHRTFSDGTSGVVAARNPADRIQISLESTVPPTALALMVVTPCYLPAG
jgi:hypothetical protein